MLSVCGFRVDPYASHHWAALASGFSQWIRPMRSPGTGLGRREWVWPECLCHSNSPCWVATTWLCQSTKGHSVSQAVLPIYPPSPASREPISVLEVKGPWGQIPRPAGATVPILPLLVSVNPACTACKDTSIFIKTLQWHRLKEPSVSVNALTWHMRDY